jgi:HD-GYP domain-containing protein (c-di-GMP phosphodiesterase class II)
MSRPGRKIPLLKARRRVPIQGLQRLYLLPTQRLGCQTLSEYPEINYEVVRALGLALDARDPLTRHHSDRVARYSIALGLRLGLDKEPNRLENLIAAAFLHDVGIIGVPDGVIQKEGGFLAHEMQLMREHAVIGERMLEGAGMPLQAKWVRHHHERVDGLGYPDGLVGDAIPLESRLIAVVESLEAMTAARYDRSRHGSALDELESHRGTQFDGDITDALLDLIVSQELDEVPYDSQLTGLIKDSRLHDPEWVLSRSAARRRRLTNVMDVEVIDVAADN